MFDQTAAKNFQWVLLSLKLTNHLIKSFKETVFVLSAPRLPLSAHSYLTPPFLLLCRTLALWGRSGCPTCPRASSWTCSGCHTHRGTCFCTWEIERKGKRVSMSVLNTCWEKHCNKCFINTHTHTHTHAYRNNNIIMCIYKSINYAILCLNILKDTFYTSIYIYTHFFPDIFLMQKYTVFQITEHGWPPNKKQD